ncbi:MAG: endolytic transglycosylase MltG [Candidatus Colwellbacteria bacterium]|nr:endolytic transglycosylase MltG [Candidatus Colwellbacteria bacterium]
MSRNLLFKSLITLILVGFVVFAGFYGIRAYRENKQESLVYPTKKISIPEGYTARQIDQLLVTSGIVREEGVITDFDIGRFKDEYWFLEDAQRVEGFLFPDTYEFYLDSTPEVVIKKFLDNFKSKTDALLSEVSASEAYKRITLASIIEEEVPDEGDDQRLVAGLLISRMTEGMRLQVDAALCYAKGELTCDIKPGDKQIDSPYNTYRNAGLPPSPISNPGLSALRAALSPKASDFRYYISDPGTKKTIFAKTLDEHNKNVVKYLR